MTAQEILKKLDDVYDGDYERLDDLLIGEDDSCLSAEEFNKETGLTFGFIEQNWMGGSRDSQYVFTLDGVTFAVDVTNDSWESDEWGEIYVVAPVDKTITFYEPIGD